MAKLLLTIILLFILTNCAAQGQPDSVRKNINSTLKTMSVEQYKTHLNDAELNNMALVADTNGFPWPAKVFGLKKELGLTAGQALKIKDINTALTFKLKQMAGLEIKNENVMDSLFRKKQINDGALIFYANRYGLYKGEIRNAILQAYYKTYTILSQAQLAKYRALLKP